MAGSKGEVGDIVFGLSLAVVGMGGTLASLLFLGLLVDALKKILPFQRRNPQDD